MVEDYYKEMLNYQNATFKQSWRSRNCQNFKLLEKTIQEALPVQNFTACSPPIYAGFGFKGNNV